MEYEDEAAVKYAHEISTLLSCGLDKKSIALVIELLKRGVHPESLADGEKNYDISSFFSCFCCSHYRTIF